MEINIVSKSKEESDKAFVNRQIKDRIDTYISYNYNVKLGMGINTYIIYKKPVYGKNNIKNIITYIIYHIDFLIKDLINSDKYRIITLSIDGNEIIANAKNPNEAKTHQFNLEHWFNSIDNIKIIIQKQYYDWEYE